MFLQYGKKWEYTVPRNKETSWAIVTINEDGRLQVLSDYGDFSYWFNGIGGPVRQFFLDLENDPRYLLLKLSPGRIFDDLLTIKTIKETILRKRLRRMMSRDAAREEWELLKRYASRLNDGSHVFLEWAQYTLLEDPLDFATYRRDAGATFFAHKVWPKVCDLIREQLFKEKHTARFSRWGLKRRVA